MEQVVIVGFITHGISDIYYSCSRNLKRLLYLPDQVAATHQRVHSEWDKIYVH